MSQISRMSKPSQSKRPMTHDQARLDMLEKVPLKEESKIQEKLELYNRRSLVFESDDKIIYLFDYSKSNESGASDVGRREVLNRHVLKKLKDDGHWSVIRHPMILNYINEKILSCTLFYTIHIIVTFVFLFLLYSYVHGKPTVQKNLIVTAVISFFIFLMLIKATLKLQAGWSAVSFWFKISYVFNFLTYAITLFYVWSFYLFKFDNYHVEVKRTITWFLPIVAILSSWINCLYVLRKSPCGPYILMMSRILKSFLGTTIIWVPTLFCFAFAFQLIMHDSGTQPWDDPEVANSSTVLAVFQSFTKISAMMVGELEANDILDRRAWIANLLLIAFEIITVILLMNLVVSLAVGDVNDLRVTADDLLLRIKLNFCIEALHLSEQVSLLDTLPCINVLHRATTNNVLVLYKHSDRVYTTYFKAIKARFFTDINVYDEAERQEVFELIMNASGLRIRRDYFSTRSNLLAIRECTLRLTETTPSGICPIRDLSQRKELNRLVDTESCYRKYQRWLIGLNWKRLLDVY